MIKYNVTEKRVPILRKLSAILLTHVREADERKILCNTRFAIKLILLVVLNVRSIKFV